MRDPVGEHAGLPRARARDDEQRAFRMQHRLALGGVQVGEIGARRGDCHCRSMLARLSGSAVTRGDSVERMGWAQSSIDQLGNETFRKVRRELGITAFGANVLVLQPGVTGRPHYHEEQDELYFVHKGRAIFDLPDDRVELGPGGCSTFSRRLRAG